MKAHRLQETDGTGRPTDARSRLVTEVLGIEDLVCPICGGPVRGEPPVGVDAEWSHTDGTPLCAGSDPVEVTSGWGRSAPTVPKAERASDTVSAPA